ncbi:hypothetical protein AMTRI_Chr07g80260 [Amborella trichopoda]|uniref:uncharacterized protein LOC18422802 isoform X2 n=1 Tax=Amborella trichopoda TaxID=13333 RepID=UPI0005D2F162|nr:uncharacterized protein LOC18422802 isoform X2 [Amborella trichopoda]|eukprot:XP_006827488.2 uncharacterized protein LOC18422802 isoform X2 [Amborella trichopoda]
MGFLSFVGRLFFSCLFIFSAWRMLDELVVDDGVFADAFESKFLLFRSHVSAKLGVNMPEIEMRHIIAADIALKGIGSIFFILGSSLGAYLLLLDLAFSAPILCDFYSYDMEKPEYVLLFHQFLQSLALFGALLFFIGMKNSFPKKVSKKKSPKAKTT